MRDFLARRSCGVRRYSGPQVKVQRSGEELPSGILKYIWTFQQLAVYTLRKPVTNVQ
jgi:hypothetical protein